MLKESNTSLSLIIPAYNEQRVIKKTLQETVNYLMSKKYPWEVIVVDDGSTDNTAKIAEKFTGKGIKVVRLIANSGKGDAIRRGVVESRYKYIIFTDCDLSVPLKNIDKFLAILSKGGDVVIGSRRVAGSKIHVHQPFVRETMGRVFTFLTRKILQTNLADFTCGFKGFSSVVAKEIFTKGLIKRWAYDSEVLFLATKAGYKITEVPVEWYNRADSRVNLKLVVLESLFDLLRIRLNYLIGKYY